MNKTDNYLDKHRNIGIIINWARSAIEGKNVETPVEHIKLALKNNILSGLMFSGVSDNDNRYGNWKDMHMPFAQSFNTKFYEKKSLLTHENIIKTLKLLNVNDLDYLGVKLLSIPIGGSSLKRRVGVNKDAIKILNLCNPV